MVHPPYPRLLICRAHLSMSITFLGAPLLTPPAPQLSEVLLYTPLANCTSSDHTYKAVLSLSSQESFMRGRIKSTSFSSDPLAPATAPAPSYVLPILLNEENCRATL